jgi:hypothetical protein
MLTAKWSRHCYQWFLLLLTLMLLLALADPNPAIAQSLTSSSPADSGTKPAEPPWLSLHYTGALFGYYRIEPDGQLKLKPPDKFLQQRRRNQQNQLLLGMGDNFSPEFGASVERELEEKNNLGEKNPCYLPLDNHKPGSQNGPLSVLYKNYKDQAPEILYKDSDRLPKMAECDNVARFLMQAGYRAIVPGREDFIYSAVWLRRLALALQAASGLKNDNQRFPEEEVGAQHDFTAGKRLITSDDGKLFMLAANLRWNFTPQGNIRDSASVALSPSGEVMDEPTKKGNTNNAAGRPWFPEENFSDTVKETCPLMFTWKLPQQGLETCVDGGDKGNTVTKEMDWLRRLDVTVDAGPDCKGKDDDPDCFPLAKAMNLRARSDVTFRRQMLENEARIAITMLSDDIGNELRSELEKTLELLSNHKAFADLIGKDPQLKLKDNKPLQDLNAHIKDLDARINLLPESSQPIIQDLKLILTTLIDKFNNASKNNVDFLFPMNVQQAAIRLLLRKIAAEQEDIGYTVVKSVPMAKTLVIGVIGQETMKAVSPSNLRTCTRFIQKQLSDGTKNIQLRDGSCGSRSNSRLEGTVVVGDPLFTVTTVLRAAWLVGHESKEKEFDKVVVMAQMPRTEAEELAAHAAVNLRNTACSDLEMIASDDHRACPERIAEDAPHIDLILSEAQSAHTSPDLEITYTRDAMTPVIAPKPAWLINRAGTGLIEPISVVTITCGQEDCRSKRTLTNREPLADTKAEPSKRLRNMAELLYEELKKVALQRPSADLANLENFWNGCLQLKACQDAIVTQYLLAQLHRSSHADVVLLEHRDLYFGPMLDGYEKYDICDEWVKKHEEELKNQEESAAYCRLRMALDRILWKGDYSERVIVNGKTLEQMLAIAQQVTESDQALTARDTIQEWLLTFGIVEHLPANLSEASMGPEVFVIPGIAFCSDPGASTETSKYCINGQRLADDGAYLVATSDHLANDQQVYKLLERLDDKYHIRPNQFITGEIADEIFRHNRDEASEKLVKAPDAYLGMRKIDELQQKRPILQVDFAKWVAGFMVRRPNQNNTALASNFSGVTDSRATTPSAQELDLEAVTRMTAGLGVNKLSQRLKFGVQSDLEYDRTVTSSLTGSAPTVTYALNNFSAGGFVQFRLSGDLPRHVFLVVAPYQYQTQITGNFLNFNLSTGSGQITVPTPRSNGFNHRLGVRYEFSGQPFAGKLFGGKLFRGQWADSYAEGGPEYSNINNVLSSLLLPNGSVCPASATLPLSTCVANNIVVTPSILFTPRTETLRTGGLYWDVHLQWAPNKEKRWSLTVDTKGDDFVLSGATLATQSRYAFTATEALNFKLIGNLLIAPAYSQFFYRNQGQGGGSHALLTKTFSVVAKWYFARDTAVPFWRQLWFLGPTSLDQTKSAKMQ